VIVGDDDGREGDGRAGAEQHTVTAGKKPTLFVQGIFLAALLCGTGIAIYYDRCIKMQTINLLMQSSQFSAENSAPPLAWPPPRLPGRYRIGRANVRIRPMYTMKLLAGEEADN
jgi:hypothetical protein